MTSSFSSPTQGGTSRFSRKAMAVLLMLGLAVIFVSSVVYRLQNPSRVIVRQEMPGGKKMNSMANMGDMGKIRDLMQSLQKNPEDVDTLMRLASVFMEMGAWDRSILFLQDILNVDPTNRDALNLYGICLYQTKDYTKSSEIFEQILSMDPNNPMAHYNLGVMKKYFLNKPKEGLDHFRKAKELAPNEPRLRKLVDEELNPKHGTVE